MKLTPEQAQIIHLSLAMRRNYILTGDAMIDPAQAERKKMPFKMLQPSQIELVDKINKIMDEVLQQL